jgi:lysophospholipase L1-like esterase
MTKDNQQPKLLIAGDSTVEDFVMREAGSNQGWGAAIGKRLDPAIKVINLAISGRSSKTFLAEGRWDTLISQVRPGDYILLQFGHNDSHSKDRPESTDAATDYRDNLRRYADDAARVGARLVFVTPPARRCFEHGQVAQWLLPYSEAMKAVAKEKNAPVVDLHSLSIALMQQRGDAGCEELFRPDDRTHFSALGAEVMAGLIVDDLARQRHPLAAFRADRSPRQ